METSTRVELNMDDDTHVLEAGRFCSGDDFNILASFSNGRLRVYNSALGGEDSIGRTGQIQLLRLLLERHPLEALGAIRDESGTPDQD
jgi:hypothetical protein